MPRRLKPRPPSYCDAPGCDQVVRRGMLMCRPHWFAVPKPLRDAIGTAWKDRRIRDWSANCLEARRILANPTGKHEPAPPAPASVIPARAAELRNRLLGERSDA